MTHPKNPNGYPVGTMYVDRREEGDEAWRWNGDDWERVPAPSRPADVSRSVSYEDPPRESHE